MATAERRDPYRSFNFQLEIDGVPLGAFSEASGLTAEGDAVDYREGTDMQQQRAQAGRAAQVHQHHAQARLHAGQVAVAVVRKHRQRPARSPQRHHRAAERGAPAGAALARGERLAQQDRRARAARRRQRGRDGVGRDRPRGADARDARSTDVACRTYAHARRLLRARRRGRAADCAAAHRRRRVRRHRAAGAARSGGPDRQLAPVRGVVRRRHRRRVPGVCGARRSSRTAAAAAGSCESRRRTPRRRR